MKDGFSRCFEADSVAAGMLFPTPLISARLAGHDVLNQALADIILARETVERGIGVSNRGGWHSREFQSWCGVEGDFVLDAGRQLVDGMTIMEDGRGPRPARVGWVVTAWANINRAGDSNRPHGHAGAYWSGVYWVDDGGAAEDPELGGQLEFSDPRGILPLMTAPHLRCALDACAGDGAIQAVAPQAGTMLLFPSWLTHSVTEYRGSRPRISVAFNFALTSRSNG
jgi:uncharacterized protein (TIGR02466 family)